MMHRAVADGPVIYLGADKELCPNGSSYRQTISGWSHASISGKFLRMSELSGRVTKTAGYRGTNCDFDKWERNYILRKIQDRYTKANNKGIFW